jgi:hypothetical protein
MADGGKVSKGVSTVTAREKTVVNTYRRRWPHSMWHGRLPVKTALTKFVFPECYNRYPNKIKYGNKATGWMVRFSKFGKDKKFVSSPKSPDRTAAHSPSIQWVTGLFPWGKAAGASS